MTITPGPYRVNPVNGRSIETLDGKRIAHNFYARKAGSSQHIKPEDVFGNAHLLAAAWDMQRVLREFVGDVEANGIKATVAEWPDILITYQKAKKALDLSEGKERKP